MKHLDYFNRNKEALMNNIDGNFNDQIKGPIAQKDVEDWVRWNINNVPNEHQKKVIDNFLTHYYSTQEIIKKDKIIRQNNKIKP